MRLGFLGTGSIAEAVVRGLAPAGHPITVSTRGRAQSSRLAAQFPNVSVAGNQGVIDASDTVFLGLMADAAPLILQDLVFRQGQQVISFMAGLPLDAVAALVSPARATAIMLPFPGIADGGSPILALGDTTRIEALFTPTNLLFVLRDAAELDAYLCAQAVLSPVTQMIATAARWLGARGADAAQAEAFLRHLVGSSLTASDCQSLLDALNTEGGYNQRLRQHMEREGLRETLSDGLDRLAGKA